MRKEIYTLNKSGKNSERGLQDMRPMETVEIRKERGFPQVSTGPTGPGKASAALQRPLSLTLYLGVRAEVGEPKPTCLIGGEGVSRKTCPERRYHWPVLK